MSVLRVLVVDDHEVVRAGLQAVLESEESIQVVGEAGTAREAVESALALKPDVVLLDVRLGEEGDVGGIEACREIRSSLPETRVLMFSSYGERETVVSALLAGASGYLMKNVGRSQLISGLQTVGRGESLLDPSVTKPVLDRLVELSASAKKDDPLSDREKEVLLLIARGRTNREIAEALVISDHTARNHVSHILDKLGLSRRSEAAAYAAKLGLLD
ncbi:MAG: response regulator transcription factor [Dehalococcoidia bacterium]|nr:response regulator transcription factor [Dehalococcoidia bacterium]